MPLSAASRLTPSLYVLQNGTVAPLLYDYVVGERLVARGELGVSRGVAAAAQLAMSGAPGVWTLVLDTASLPFAARCPPRLHLFIRLHLLMMWCSIA